MDDAYDAIAEGLRADLNASRVTIRLDLQDGRYLPIVGEAVADGIPPTRGLTFPDMEKVPTMRYLHSTRTTLVQNDTLAGPAAYQPLAMTYGIRSQVLAPIIRGELLVGIIAIHHVSADVRIWSEADVCLAEQTASRIDRSLTEIS